MLCNVVTFSEDAGDIPAGVFGWLVDEINICFFDRPVSCASYLERLLAADEWLATLINGIEQLVKTLTVEFGKSLPDRQSNERAVADQAPIGSIDVSECMRRLREQGHKAGCLRKQVLQPLAFGLAVPDCEHLFGRLIACAIQATDLSRLIADGGIGEGEPCLLIITIPVHRQRQIFQPRSLACESFRHQWLQIVPDFVPDLLKRLAEGSRMLLTKDCRVGVVIEQAKLIAPRDKHRKARTDHQRDDRLKRGAPLSRCTERGPGFVHLPHHLSHRSTVSEKRQRINRRRYIHLCDHSS